MEHNKPKLINDILQTHIMHAIYNATFNVFHNEFNIDLFKTDNYDDIINPYKNNLTTRLTEYLNRIYSYEEVLQMSVDNNSLLYHRMVTSEYHDIIFSETRIFSIKLRERFAQDGINKKSFIQKIFEKIGF